MKKLILLLLFIPLVSFGQDYKNGTKLYGDFYFNMPTKSAIKIFKKNKEKYQNIDLDTGLSFWMFNKPFLSSFQSFQNRKNISYVILFSKKYYSEEVTSNKMNRLKEYFESKKYKVISKQTHWDTPVFYDNTQYGMLLESPDNNIIVELKLTKDCMGYDCNTGIRIIIKSKKTMMSSIGKNIKEDNSDF